MSNELSEKMSVWLGHVRAASERGITLSAYAAQEGISASGLYQAKSQLMKLGAWPRSVSRRALRSSSRKARAKSSVFVPVQVATSSACRLSHVSGWRIECDSLPPTSWLNELLRVDLHAAA